jgi:putative ABC transport system ATP-binding protein
VSSVAPSLVERPREPIIEIRGVSKDYESGAGVVRALRDVDLTIQQGEFVAIVGTSGSGKSTLMNILGCLDRPTRGTYELASIDVGARTNDGRAIVRNRLIGFIFQGFNLLPRTTALENCELPLQYRGFAAAERRKRAMKALDQVQLGDRVHHKPNELSGGQQQRVAIARALVTDPPLLLADEPTGNLDTRTSLEVLALLQKLNRENGITIVLVTHEHDIAACASRIITVRDGKIVSDVVQAAPSDAASELAALPPQAVYDTSSVTVDSHDPAAAARAGLGGPVPFSVFMAMAGGGILGGIAAAIYNFGVLGAANPWVTQVFVILGQSYLGARYATRRLGRPPTVDQRVRMALWWNIVSLAIAGIFLIVTLPKLPQAILERFDQMSSLLVIGLVVLVLAAPMLLSYLLLTLFTPSARRGIARPAKT